MVSKRECLNFKNGNYLREPERYGNCKRFIEAKRAKWAKFCETCGKNRPADWAHEHPEKVKLYNKDEATQRWRRKQKGGWKGYIKRYRARNPLKWRQRNREYMREYRRRQKQTPAKEQQEPRSKPVA